MRNTLVIIMMFVMSNVLFAQKFVTKSGKISFYSDTPMEKILAVNKQVNSAVDITSGVFVFNAVIKSFEFEKALMQEHFNENYAESDKYPNSTFKGNITNYKNIDFTKNGSYDAEVAGDLTIHGVAKKVNVKGSFEVKDGKINGKAKFDIKPKDYNIKIPTAVNNQVAETVQITVDVTLNKL